jgi:hypothetical protein
MVHSNSLLDYGPSWADHLTLAEMNARTYGSFVPAFLALLVIAYRFQFGRWPHPAISIGAPVWAMLSGLAAMLASSHSDWTGAAIQFAGGTITGSWGYIVPVALVAAADRTVWWWKHRVVGNHRRRMHKTTRRGTV